MELVPSNIEEESFYEYMKELGKIGGWSCSKEELYASYHALLGKGFIQWISILSDDGQYAGFLVLGTYPECHPMADAYIVNYPPNEVSGLVTPR